MSLMIPYGLNSERAMYVTKINCFVKIFGVNKQQNENILSWQCRNFSKKFLKNKKPFVATF